MIGTLQDPEFEKFEANLDWLETTACSWSSSTLHGTPGSRQRPAVQQIVTADGDRCLPSILYEIVVDTDEPDRVLSCCTTT